MIVGVFASQINPFIVLGQEGAAEYVAAAELRGVKVVFFDDTGVDFEKEMIRGLICKQGVWELGEFKFPPIVINASMAPRRKRSETEEKLLKKIRTTTRLIEDKYRVYERIKEAGKYSKYMSPSILLQDREGVYSFIKKHKKVVFKPKGGRKGRGIYFVYQQGNQFFCHDFKNRRPFNREEMDKFIEEMIEKDYLVQTLVDCGTKDNVPFDFRIHVQRNGQGQWVINTGYARIGSMESVETRLRTPIDYGQYQTDIGYFLAMEYGREKGGEFEKKLYKLALELADHVDGFYPYQVEEFGLDMTIDRSEKIWVFELNTIPVIRRNTFQRALNRIDYALHLAWKGRIDQREICRGLEKFLEICYKTGIMVKTLQGSESLQGEKMKQVFLSLIQAVQILSKNLQNMEKVGVLKGEEDHLIFVKKQVELEYIRSWLAEGNKDKDQEIEKILQDLLENIRVWEAKGKEALQEWQPDEAMG